MIGMRPKKSFSWKLPSVPSRPESNVAPGRSLARSALRVARASRVSLASPASIRLGSTDMNHQ